MKVGYARVSRQDQRLEPQRDVLLVDVCDRVFEEKISSRESERGALREALRPSRGDCSPLGGILVPLVGCISSEIP